MPSLVPLPGIDPIVPLPRTDAFDDAAWTFEPKYDGLRGFVYGSEAGCEIRSPWDDRFEDFAELRARVARVLGAREVILDGEIVSLDPRGRPVFSDLLRGRGYLAFAAFDLLWLDGRDLRSAPARRAQAGARRPCCRRTRGRSTRSSRCRSTAGRCSRPRRRWISKAIVAKRTADPYPPDTVWYAIRNPAYRQGDGRVPVARTRRLTVRRER